MNIYLISAFIFVLAVVVIELLSYGYATYRHPDRAEIRRKLRKIAFRSQYLNTPTDITRKTIFSEIGLLNQFLKRITFAKALQRLIYQANASFSPAFYLMLILLLAQVRQI